MALDLKLLEGLAEHLRGAMRELAREAGAEGKIEIRLHIGDVQKGSVILGLIPEIVGVNVPGADAVLATLIEDINSIEENRPRVTMGAGLLKQYRSLVAVAEKAGGLSVGYRGLETMIGPVNSIAFQSVLRDNPEAGTRVAGYIESVNIHVKPWMFGLYTKLDRERVECRFPDPMLDAVLSFMERKALVEVTGEGQYGPVGLTPRTVTLDNPPVELVFQPKALFAFRRSLDIVQEGESAAQALRRIRRETENFG